MFHRCCMSLYCNLGGGGFCHWVCHCDGVGATVIHPITKTTLWIKAHCWLCRPAHLLRHSLLFKLYTFSFSNLTDLTDIILIIRQSVNNHSLGDWDVDGADHYRLGVSVKQSCTMSLGRSCIWHDKTGKCISSRTLWPYNNNFVGWPHRDILGKRMCM